ncbi:hypothetical protein BC567DRAFT_89800 [Phyllosticta citribraziliensis]
MGLTDRMSLVDGRKLVLSRDTEPGRKDVEARLGSGLCRPSPGFLPLCCPSLTAKMNTLGNIVTRTPYILGRCCNDVVKDPWICSSTPVDPVDHVFLPRVVHAHLVLQLHDTRSGQSLIDIARVAPGFCKCRPDKPCSWTLPFHSNPHEATNRASIFLESGLTTWFQGEPWVQNPPFPVVDQSCPPQTPLALKIL